jgi:hypothetical protein
VVALVVLLGVVAFRVLAIIGPAGEPAEPVEAT